MIWLWASSHIAAAKESRHGKFFQSRQYLLRGKFAMHSVYDGPQEIYLICFQALNW